MVNKVIFIGTKLPAVVQFERETTVSYYFVGSEWKLINPPPGKHLMQISVGSNALWVVTKDREIFFNTINSSTSSSSWKSMVGEFDQIAVGPNDQVKKEIGNSIPENSWNQIIRLKKIHEN